MTRRNTHASDAARSRRVELSKQTRTASLRSQTFNPDDHTVEIVWTTGATVRRADWDGEFDEALSLSPGAVRLERLNSGAPFLNTHDATGLNSVIGSVVPGSAKIEDGRGTCRVLLSRARDVADVVAKIREGSIRNVSVGYWVHSMTEVDQASGVPLRTATDWEPLEISAVPIPADPGSQIRSAPGRRTSTCRITKARNSSARGTRADEILARGRRFGCLELAREHVRAGTSLDEFKNVLLARITDQQPASEASTKDTNMSNFARDFARGAAKARKALGVREDEPGTSVKKDKDDEQDRDEPQINDEGYLVDEDGNYVDEDGEPCEDPVKASADDDDDPDARDEDDDEKPKGDDRSSRSSQSTRVRTSTARHVMTEKRTQPKRASTPRYDDNAAQQRGAVEARKIAAATKAPILKRVARGR